MFGQVSARVPVPEEPSDLPAHAPTRAVQVRRWREDVPWVQDMVIAHRFYRLGLASMPSLVGRVRSGERRRARQVRDHYLMIVRALDRHQAYENAHIWPTIARRAVGQALLAERPLNHHRMISEQTTALESLWSAWVESPDQETGEPLRDRLVVLFATVNHCLDEEEADLLPLIERHITVAEWAEFGRYSASTASKRELFLMAGMVAGHLTSAEWDDLEKQQPSLVWAVARFAQPFYRRYARALGLPTPPSPKRQRRD
jgi:hypothetical protein